MITAAQYFGEKPRTDEQERAAETLLGKVTAMLDALIWAYPIDPDTGTSISGSKGGAGDGGFRLSNAATGAPNSKHKTAHAVDVYDPENILDASIDDEMLAEFGLYREAPDATRGWCHLQDVAPGSGKRTFNP